MDLQTVQEKITSHKYGDLSEFEQDVELMIRNCMLYNSKDTPFYKAALRMRDQVNIRACRGHRVMKLSQYLLNCADGMNSDVLLFHFIAAGWVRDESGSTYGRLYRV